MPLANRSILAILYSSLIFGSISCPYYYIGLGALSTFKLKAVLILVPWLVVCTATLLPIFAGRTRLNLLVGIAGLAALASTYFILSVIANFSLLRPVEYWFYLVLLLSLAWLVALGVLLAAPSTRLERFIAARFSNPPASYFGYLGLLLALAFACNKLYQYYLYKTPPV